jgi:hypothetical protein
MQRERRAAASQQGKHNDDRPTMGAGITTRRGHEDTRREGHETKRRRVFTTKRVTTRSDFAI